MSYSIFYRAMFIKMSNGEYIPMIESGDNNVWDVDRNRRSRSWSSCRWLHESEQQRRRFSLTESEILDAARREILRTIESYAGEEPAFGGQPYTEEQIRADLGFFNAIKVSGHQTTTASQFLNFFKSGLRNAVTFDELRCGVRLSWYELSDDKTSSRWCTDYAADEDELARKWTEYLGKGITPWIGLSESNAECAWKLVKERSRKPRPERKAPTEFFIIAFNYAECERYMVSLSSRNMKFNPWKDNAYKYSSRKMAENAAQRITARFSQVKDVRVEKISA